MDHFPLDRSIQDHHVKLTTAQSDDGRDWILAGHPFLVANFFYKKENSLSSLDSRRFHSAFSTISDYNLSFSFCTTIVFNFSLEDCSTHEKLETMVT